MLADTGFLNVNVQICVHSMRPRYPMYALLVFCSIVVRPSAYVSQVMQEGYPREFGIAFKGSDAI